uniref:RBD domain-containing protein n=1 Tax=Salmo trutta TaxID=8032 RepID=A0A674ARD0_SALTR
MSPELNVVPEAQGASVGLYSSSNSNLPTVPSEEASGVGKLTSWAVSFERLLQCSILHEVSVENILFGKACEKFRQIPLNQEARSIYNTYLSGSASHPINIDDTVRIEERDVFKLMKFDSYTRFVHSQLYQSCMLANVEGRPLPELGPRSKSTATRKTSGTDSASLSDRHKADQKPQKKRCSWGGTVSYNGDSIGSEFTRWHVAQAENCCVFLPDGIASLAPARAGLSIRTMLTGLCEKKGLPLSDVIIYLQGKDKLSLSQSCSVLKEQQVFLELSMTFIVSTGKTVGIVVTSNETLQEAMTPVLQKQRLLSQDVIVTMVTESLSMSTALTSLDKKKLTLDRVKGYHHWPLGEIPERFLSSPATYSI